jgi:hypothetical protein
MKEMEHMQLKDSLTYVRPKRTAMFRPMRCRNAELLG